MADPNDAPSGAGRYDADDEGGERYGLPVETSRILRALLAGKRLLLVAMLIGAVIGVVTAKFLVKRSYDATAMLKFEGIPEIEGLPQEREPNVGGMLQALFLQSVLQEIKSRGNRPEPVEVIGLSLNAEADLAKVVRIRAQATDPGEAAILANTAMHVFLEHQVEVQRNRINEAITSLTERVAAATTTLAGARRRYDSFREEQGISDLSTEQEQALEEAADLRAQRDRKRSALAVLEAQIQRIRQEIESTPETVTGRMQPRRNARLQELQEQLTRARANLSDTHPRIQALRQEIAAIQAGMVQGSDTGETTFSNPRHRALQASLSEAMTELEGLRHEVEGLTQNAAAAQERVEEFSSMEGQASQLLAAVRVSEQLLNELNATKTHLEDAMRDPVSGFRVMNEAVPPGFANPSKKKYIVAAGVPVALMAIVIVFLLIRELRGLKLHTANEVAFWGKSPVIGSSTWPRNPEAIDDLIADMDDFVPEAQGKMLVVGACDDAQALARQFAARLSSDWYDTTMVGAPPFPSDAPDAYDMGGVDDLPGSPTAIVPYQASALALPQARAHHVDAPQAVALQVEAWDGSAAGPALRRAARLADRVCVVVPAGLVSGLELGRVKTRLGREEGVGFVVVNVADHDTHLQDRVGPVEDFWAAVREQPRSYRPT